MCAWILYWRICQKPVAGYFWYHGSCELIMNHRSTRLSYVCMRLVLLYCSMNHRLHGLRDIGDVIGICKDAMWFLFDRLKWKSSEILCFMCYYWISHVTYGGYFWYFHGSCELKPWKILEDFRDVVLPSV